LAVAARSHHSLIKVLHHQPRAVLQPHGWTAIQRNYHEAIQSGTVRPATSTQSDAQSTSLEVAFLTLAVAAALLDCNFPTSRLGMVRMGGLHQHNGKWWRLLVSLRLGNGHQRGKGSMGSFSAMNSSSLGAGELTANALMKSGPLIWSVRANLRHVNTDGGN